MKSIGGVDVEKTNEISEIHDEEIEMLINFLCLKNGINI